METIHENPLSTNSVHLVIRRREGLFCLPRRGKILILLLFSGVPGGGEDKGTDENSKAPQLNQVGEGGEVDWKAEEGGMGSGLRWIGMADVGMRWDGNGWR